MTERFGMHPPFQTKCVIYQFAAPLEVADPDAAARSRRSFDHAESNELVDELPSPRFINLRPQRLPDLTVARASTRPLNTLDNVSQRLDPARR